MANWKTVKFAISLISWQIDWISEFEKLIYLPHDDRSYLEEITSQHNGFSLKSFSLKSVLETSKSLKSITCWNYVKNHQFVSAGTSNLMSVTVKPFEKGVCPGKGHLTKGSLLQHKNTHSYICFLAESAESCAPLNNERVRLPKRDRPFRKLFSVSCNQKSKIKTQPQTHFGEITDVAEKGWRRDHDGGKKGYSTEYFFQKNKHQTCPSGGWSFFSACLWELYFLQQFRRKRGKDGKN